ncbi:MAG: hypothetical protein HYZ75_14875 [Elusimicrobia bacterium]|nr:hypothetical protein [Elusimicrobiota bacterium]
MDFLSGLLGFLVGLLPSHPGRSAPDRIPLVEVVQARGAMRVRVDPKGKHAYAAAEEEALRQAVHHVLKLYHPDVDAARIAELDRRFLPKARRYVREFRVLETAVHSSSAVVTIEAQIDGDKLKADLYGQGLRKPGERLEMAAHFARLEGGDSAVHDAGLGRRVENRRFEGGLMGLSMRYHWSDLTFTEASWLALVNPVEVASFYAANGRRSSVMMTQYSPMTLGMGVNILRFGSLRGNSYAGMSRVAYRGRAEPGAGVPAFKGSHNWSGYWGAELRWTPLRRLGASVRSDWRARRRFGLLYDKEVSAWTHQLAAVFTF